MKKTRSIITTIYSEFLKANFKSFFNSVCVFCGLTPKLDIYELKNGIKLKFTPGTLDLMVIRECLINNLYTKFIEEKKLNTVIDLGCHKGYFVTGLLSNGVDVKKVICVDPFLDNLSFFKKNIKLNENLFKKQLTELIFEPSAISNNNGKRIFYITQNSVNHSLNNPIKYDKVVKKIKVNTITIKTLLRKFKLTKIDLIKMDIEGTEFDLFRSAEINLLLTTKYLVIEIHPGENHKASEITNKLKSSGFTIKYPNVAYKNLIFAVNNI